MKKSNAASASAFFMLSGGVALVSGLHQGEVQAAGGIRITDGVLSVDGEVVARNLSLHQTQFDYLFIYLPDVGLWTVGGTEFEGGVQVGTFRGRTLAVELEDGNLVLKSSLPILGEGKYPAWAKLDKDFKLQAKGVVFGYGRRVDTPYHWGQYVEALGRE